MVRYTALGSQSPDSVLTYVEPGSPLDERLWKLVDVDGKHVGFATVRSVKNAPRTWIGLRLYFVHAVLLGEEHKNKKFHGRTFGPGMALMLRPMKATDESTRQGKGTPHERTRRTDRTPPTPRLSEPSIEREFRMGRHRAGDRDRRGA